MRQIIDHHRQMDEVRLKLLQAEQTEKHFLTAQGIRNDSKLKVHIVNAVNLNEGQH